MATTKIEDKEEDNVTVSAVVKNEGGQTTEATETGLTTLISLDQVPMPLEAAASSQRDEQKSLSTVDLAPSAHLEVSKKIWRWQKIQQASPKRTQELFLLSLEAESVIVGALTEFTPLQVTYFAYTLRQNGVEVKSLQYHKNQAQCFADRLALLLRDNCLVNCSDLFCDDSESERDLDSGPDSVEENCYPALEISNLPAENRLQISPTCLQRSGLDSLKPVKTRLTNLQKALQEFLDVPDTIVDELRTSQIPAMAISTDVLPLPVLPQGWTSEKDFKAIGTISTATQRSIEPVGPHFLAHARRARHKRTFSEDDRIQAQESVKKVEDDDAGDISEPEDPSMLLRDAKDWKGQDHYAVLGLSKYRWKATEEQIKRAHRKKVLRHHPDKKAAAGNTEDDSFFKCIQKATEILLDPVKRRQFDSVDEVADVEPPTKKQTQKGNFYKLWNSVFKAEARFSRIQPVPKLGDEKSTKEEVENFYNFWYNFDSWRSFEYQDEDVPDDNENRDQKRHMERKNNNARKKKKTEDSARLRKLLDDCSSLDERIKKFRQEANASKNKKRLEKETAEKKAVDEAKAKKEAEEKATKEAEEAAKVEREQGKKVKEAAKNAVKKNKRVLKSSVKDANYFVQGVAPATTIDAVLNDVELVQGKVDPDEIAALASKLIGLKVADDIKNVWSGEVKRLFSTGKLKEGDAKTLVV